MLCYISQKYIYIDEQILKLFHFFSPPVLFEPAPHGPTFIFAFPPRPKWPYAIKLFYVH